MILSGFCILSELDREVSKLPALWRGSESARSLRWIALEVARSVMSSVMKLSETRGAMVMHLIDKFVVSA